jgi:hypothetical protein
VKRWLVGLWLAIGVVVWNGIFDLLLTRGVKEYLFRQAAHDLGRGERFTMRQIMDQTIADAVLTASFWALAIAGAGLLTVALCTRSSTTGITSPEPRG